MADLNVIHELTMLYLRQKDISSLTPEQLLDEYKKVYAEIKDKKSQKYGTKWTFQLLVDRYHLITVLSKPIVWNLFA